MALSVFTYGNFPSKLINKEIDWDNDNIKLMLCTDQYIPNQDTHIYKSDVNNEVVGEGYTVRGKLVTGKTIFYNSTTNVTTVDADDVIWANSTITAKYAILYCDTGNDATSSLIQLIDFGFNPASFNGDFKVEFNVDGILTFSVA